MGFLKSVAAFCVIAAACNNPVTTATVPPAADTTETDTLNYAMNEDSVKLTLDNPRPPEGFYQITLPCTNCKGIEHTVLFNPDLSYRIEEKVLEGNKPVSRTTGTWKPVHDDIWLYKDSSVAARYTWYGDTLNYIDLKSGVRMPMRPLPGVVNNTAWKNKKAEGAAFFGVGNEPFWNLTIHAQKGMVFNLADSARPMTFKAVTPVTTPDSTVYQTRNDSATLRVVIYNTFCSDGMSDNMYSNSVQVLLNNKLYQGCGMVLQ